MICVEICTVENLTTLSGRDCSKIDTEVKKEFHPIAKKWEFL
jgi:hypothetical protein